MSRLWRGCHSACSTINAFSSFLGSICPPPALVQHHICTPKDSSFQIRKVPAGQASMSRAACARGQQAGRLVGSGCGICSVVILRPLPCFEGRDGSATKGLGFPRPLRPELGMRRIGTSCQHLPFLTRTQTRLLCSFSSRGVCELVAGVLRGRSCLCLVLPAIPFETGLLLWKRGRGWQGRGKRCPCQRPEARA